MKIYFKILINVVVLVLSFGFVLPFLISFPDTLLVAAGFVYAFVLLPTFMYYYNHGIATKIMESLK